jgi:hypothetical protein
MKARVSTGRISMLLSAALLLTSATSAVADTGGLAAEHSSASASEVATTAGPNTHLLEAFPPIVFNDPNWRTIQVNEPSEAQGYTEFDEVGPGKEYLELSWSTTETVAQRIQALSTPFQGETFEEVAGATVLGNSARVFVRHLGGLGVEAFAVLSQGGRTYQAFESTHSFDSFRTSLSKLQFTDKATFKKSLPGPIKKGPKGKGIQSNAAH